MIHLRDYQEGMVAETRLRLTEGFRRVLLVGPCGCGKGSIASYIIHNAATKGKVIYFLVNRRELVKDMSKRLKQLDIPHGVMMGAQSKGSHLPVQIVSVDTLRNRIEKITRKPDLVFIDEAHTFVTDSVKKILAALTEGGAKVIEMTATPWLLSGRGMKEIADVMVKGPTTAELVERGFLVPSIVYAPSTPDLTSVHKVGGDYNQDELGDLMGSKKLVGDIVSHWKELAYGRRTVVFAVNRRHSEEIIAKSFQEAGVRAVAVDANTKDVERDAVWAKLAKHELDVVCSVGIISYGWDVPEVDCIILARPTLSLSLHRQQIGRGARLAPWVNKKDYLVLDHAGNTVRHSRHNGGLPEDEPEWTLDGKVRKQSEAEMKLKLPLVCPKCMKVCKPGTQVCQCGYKFSSFQGATDGDGKPVIETEEGKLVKVESRVFIYPEATGDEGRDKFRAIAKDKNYNPGWIHHQSKALDAARAQYRAHFGAEPKAHWTGGMITSMIKRSEQQNYE